MKTYTIRVTTKQDLYADYIVEAKDLLEARLKAWNAFMRDYPNAEVPARVSLTDPKPEVITEIMNIIKENGYYV